MPVVKSAIRAIDVLEYIAAAKKPPFFAEIVSALGIPNSSLFYLLNTLIQRGYLRQNGNKGSYMLGPSLVVLANAVTRVSWARLIEPLVGSVWKELKETTSYFERRGDEMECMIVKLAEHSLIPIHRVGQRSPMYVFSGGKIFLADMGEPELDAYLKRTKLERLTPNTLTTKATVKREIAKVSQMEFAISREEHSVGTIGISVGLRNGGELIGTLGVAVPAVRFNSKIEEQITSTLKATAPEFAAAHAAEPAIPVDA